MNCYYCKSPLENCECNYCKDKHSLQVVQFFETVVNIRATINNDSYFSQYLVAYNITHLYNDIGKEILSIKGEAFTPSNFKKKVKTYLVFQ